MEQRLWTMFVARMTFLADTMNIELYLFCYYIFCWDLNRIFVQCYLRNATDVTQLT